ncbi:SagB family peptide dehydrogenase [Streptomyces sp. LP05-1]|uniref:SagB family peptide dehydrogenase n=1 Tax=Streptomyces pyxinae TaxID=2970734 RepID=A0ABT2CQS7_9ACTN|nr:SagB family peptide dehydrogenase [Streptomyces sp. LP05-1]MCS0639621.1 SagB family peptide dehydrogenase [Streptomyces sp. LP05-1]
MLIGHLAGTRLNELWSLRDDTFLDSGCDPSGGSGPVVLDTHWGELRLEAPGPAVREALRRMVTGPVSLRNVVADFPESGTVRPGTEVSAEATELLEVLRRIQHVVVRTVAVGSFPLLSVVPLSAQARFAPLPPPGNPPARLSRFTVLRHARDGLCLESPLSLHRAELLRPEASVLLVRLGGTAGGPAAAAPPEEWNVPALPDSFVDTALSYLAAAGLVVFAERGHGGRPGTPPRFGEDHDPALPSWAPDDLPTHARGRHGGAVGSVFEHVGRLPAEPVAGAAHGPPAVLLPCSGADEPAAGGPGSGTVLEGRPLPVGGTGELTAEQVGSLLDQVARVRSVRLPGPGGLGGCVHDERAHSGPGDPYTLELYLLVGKNTWPAPGAYHYDPVAHALESVDAVPEALAELSANAQAEAGLPEPPELLIAITARFRRASREFSGTACACLHKDVGALRRTLSLVATTMGLGSCALTAGDADAAPRALRLDRRTESGVGEFLIGPPASSGEEPRVPRGTGPPPCSGREPVPAWRGGAVRD